MILESKLVTHSTVARKLSKMAGVGKRRTVQEWVDALGRDNVQLAMEHGVLGRVITEAETVEVSEVMKNGDYVVYQRDGLYIMYHMSDDKLWRTEGQKVDDLTPENSKAVDGISMEDHAGTIRMSGHETPPPEDIPPGTPHEIEMPEPAEQFEGDFDVESPGEPDMEEPMAPEAGEIPTLPGTETNFEPMPGV